MFASASGPMVARPWPLQPLLDMAGETKETFAGRIGLSSAVMYRAEAKGLTDTQADRYAVAAGFHPAEVWGWDAWMRVGLEGGVEDLSCEREDCGRPFEPAAGGGKPQRFCSTACRRRESDRRRAVRLRAEAGERAA